MFKVVILLATSSFSQVYGAKSSSVTSVLTKEECRRLIINAKANNSVDYQSGIDTRGNKIASADLEGESTSKDYKLGKDIHIDLQGKLRHYAPAFPGPTLGNQDFLGPALKNSEVEIGSIKLYKDGKLWINDVPVFDEEQAELEKACRAKFPDL